MQHRERRLKIFPTLVCKPQHTYIILVHWSLRQPQHCWHYDAKANSDLLESNDIIAVTFARNDTSAPYQASAEVVDYVAVEIRHHHDIELPWVGHHLPAEHTTSASAINSACRYKAETTTQLQQPVSTVAKPNPSLFVIFQPPCSPPVASRNCWDTDRLLLRVPGFGTVYQRTSQLLHH